MGEIRMNVNTIFQAKLKFYCIPSACGIDREVINIKAIGNFVFREQGNFSVPFRINWANSGFVARLGLSGHQRVHLETF